MKNMGVEGLDSSKDLQNSTVRPSTYLEPNFSSMKALKYRRSDTWGKRVVYVFITPVWMKLLFTLLRKSYGRVLMPWSYKVAVRLFCFSIPEEISPFRDILIRLAFSTVFLRSLYLGPNSFKHNKTAHELCIKNFVSALCPLRSLPKLSLHRGHQRQKITARWLDLEAPA